MWEKYLVPGDFSPTITCSVYTGKEVRKKSWPGEFWLRLILKAFNDADLLFSCTLPSALRACQVHSLDFLPGLPVHSETGRDQRGESALQLEGRCRGFDEQICLLFTRLHRKFIVCGFENLERFSYAVAQTFSQENRFPWHDPIVFSLRSSTRFYYVFISRWFTRGPATFNTTIVQCVQWKRIYLWKITFCWFSIDISSYFCSPLNLYSG